MTENPRVSAIIANWNGAHHLRICLPSLLEQSFTSLETIVVDNGSSDDSEEVTRQFNARWLGLAQNIGLAPALNRGAAVATGEFLLFVNNDMRFDLGFVAALAEPLQKDETIFATDGMQFNWDGNEKAHLAVRLTKEKREGRGLVEVVPGLNFFQSDENKETPVFMASAACMLARKTLFEKLGGFENHLPLGYEDVEICWRAWLHGWKTIYIPGAICWHRVGASGKSEEGARRNFEGVLRGRLLLASKLLPSRYAIRTWLVTTAALAKDLSRLKWRFARSRVRMLVEMAALLPQLWREKRAMFEAAGRSPEELLGSLLDLPDDGTPKDQRRIGG